MRTEEEITAMRTVRFVSKGYNGLASYEALLQKLVVAGGSNV